MKSKKTWLALLLVLALMLCLLPAAALADNAAADEAEETPADARAAEAEAVEEAEEEPAAEAEKGADEAEDPAKDAGEAVEEELAGESAEEAGPAGESIICEEEDVVYALPGDTVYSNGGTVYSNGGTVYNNAGLVYNNAGLVYNNAGTVYSNGGTVYNNAGAVYSNGATVYSFEGSVEESVIYGYYRVTLSEKLADYAVIEGLVTLEEGGDPLITPDAVLTIAPVEGFVITELLADAGELTANEDGSYSLTGVESALTLDAAVQPEAPVLSLATGTYGEAQTLAISAVEGAEIYYSTDGKLPDVDNSELYAGPIEITEGVTVSAVAVVKGVDISEPAQAAYAVVELTAPTFENVEEGYTQPAAQAVAAANPGAVDAVVAEVRLEGDDADCFTLTGSARGGVIRAGADGDTQWRLRPAANLEKGSYSAVLVFTFDSGETAELTLRFRVK